MLYPLILKKMGHNQVVSDRTNESFAYKLKELIPFQRKSYKAAPTLHNFTSFIRRDWLVLSYRIAQSIERDGT